MGSLKLYLLIIFSALILSGNTVLGSDSDDHVKVMSYNIRTSSADDKENNWKYRKNEVIAQIKYHNPDVLGMQEVTPEQLTDLIAGLSDYDWYGVGRDDGMQKGEYSCIFFKKDRFKKLDTGTFWLSENINQPGKSWDAAYPRICSWVKLKDKETKTTFFHFNTHFDHRGQIARENSSLLIIDQIKSLSGNLPVVLTGDFNVKEDNKAYANMLTKTVLKDTYHTAESGVFGPKGTFSTFYVKEKLSGKIDYIFVNQNTRVLSAAILTDQNEGRYYSDHLPLTATIQLKK